MASVNGALSAPSSDPPSASPLLSTKRKREESDDVNGSSGVKGIAREKSEVSKEQVADFVEVIRRYDPSSSILSHALPQRSSDEPHAKRKKSDIAESSTIASRAAAGTYGSIDDVVKDVELLCTSVLKSLQGTGQSSDRQGPDGEKATQIKAFRKRVADLVLREEGFKDGLQAAPTTAEKSQTNGRQEVKPVIAGEGKVVLTLYGNAQGPRQLFSSLQITHDSEPLREIGLPNGISTTQIVPLQTKGLPDEKKRVQTLGDLFPAPTNTPSLQPPKPSKASPTRGSVLGWYLPSAVDPVRQRPATYFTQQISTGRWLAYSSGVESDEAKKKQTEKSNLDALFRSVYSGFAPSRDDSAAVAPVGQLGRIWWQRMGGKSFERMVQSTVDEDAEELTDAPEDLAEDITDWDEQVVDPSLENMGPPTKSIMDKEVDEILEGISELVETLHSYQRNRNLSLPRQTGSSTEGSNATTPSEAETATYNILKSQLALMVSTLPPYAVAKLDSDQLEELAISTKIPVFLDDFKGVMEEDEAAARAKLAAMSAASSNRTGQQVHRSSSSLYGNQYATPGRSGASNNYYSTRTPVRPSPAMPRQPATVPAQYGQRGSPQAAYRPVQSYGTPSYPQQQPARTSQTPYGPNGAHQYFQSPAPQQYTSAYSQQFHAGGQSAQSAALSTRYQPGQVYGQQQLAPGAGGYGYNKLTPYGQTNVQRPMGSPQTMNDRRYFQNGTTQPIGAFGATGYHTVMTPAEQATMMERQRAQLAQQQNLQMQARAAAQASAASMNGSVKPQESS